MATADSIKLLQQSVDKCTAIPIDKLIHRSEWGEIDFEKARAPLERMLSMVEPLKILPIEQLPDSVVNQIRGQLEAIGNFIAQINSYRVAVDNPIAQRDSLCNQLASQVDSTYPIVTPHIPYLAYLRGDVDANIKALTSKVTEADGIISTAKTAIENKTKEIDSLVITAREVAAKAGVAIFRKDFEDEAKRQSEIANNWLKATAGAAAITLITALLFVFFFHGETAQEVIQRLSPKLVLLGTLLTATIWCSRMYRTARHQEAINRHRSNALLTFQAFSQAAGDDAATRSAVLMETTRSIFSHTATGFIDDPNSSSEGNFKIIETIRNLTKNE